MALETLGSRFRGRTGWQRLTKSSSVAPSDISLQHIGTKGSGSPPLSPCGRRLDRVSPVPVFSLNYGAILAIAPPFSIGSAGNRGESRAAIA